MSISSSDFIKTAEIIADSKIANLKLDKTIQAVITEQIDLSAGEYRVEYEGNIFIAFSTKTSEIYDLNDKVYIKVPENDFSNKKFIEGKVDNLNSNSQSMVENVLNQINEIGPSWNLIYSTLTPSEKYGICAGVDNNNVLCFDRNNEVNINLSDNIFQTYSKYYGKIKISADFLTTFNMEHVKGNYGLIVSFIVKDYQSDNNEKIVSYRLDFNSFTGNPYNYNVFSPQSAILDIDTDYLLGLDSILFFQENFETDKIYNYDGSIKFENTTINNIFVQNISLQFVEVIDYQSDQYYLSIITPQGNGLINPSDRINLIGRLKYSGREVLSENNCTCDWYVQDASITIGSEEYDANVGGGWRKINADFNTLTLKYEDVLFENVYKLRVVYNNKTTLSKDIKIYRYNSDYDLLISQTTDNENIILKIQNNKDLLTYQGDWYYKLGDGTYISIANNVNELVINSYLIYSTVYFYCLVKEQDKIICTLEKIVLNANQEDDLSITYIGDDNFQYDANGDISIETVEKEKTLQGKISWKDGYASAYKIEWMLSDKTIIGGFSSKISPANSMMQELWVDNEYILHYKIKQKYSKSNLNNTVILKVTAVNGIEYDFYKEILFTKIGDQGTNGTTYISLIRPVEKDKYDIKLSGLNPLIYNNNWGNPIYYRNFVYKDGNIINNDPNYSIEYNWTGENITYHQLSTQKDVCYINGTGNLENITYSILKCETKITDKIDNKTIYLYYNYPINILVGNLDSAKISSNVPEYIKYNSNGLNATYYNDPINILYNDTNYTEFLVSLTEDLVQINKNDNNEYHLRPASKFLYESGIAILKCTFDSSSNYLIYSIMMYLDTYGNEAINGWDGTSIKTENGAVLAPQVGAGEKDSNGKFTGIVMGQDTNQQKIGLYGYQKGINTFGLTEEGKAYFGSLSGGGRIEIDGTTAKISGGDGGSSNSGMTITLADLRSSGTTKAIQIGNDNFYIQYNGKMHAVDADIKGKITTDELTASGGTIGGWVITKNSIASPGNTTVLNSNGDITIRGTLEAYNASLYNAYVSGSIDTDDLNAYGGAIGGWTINKSSIYNGNTVLDSNGISTDTVVINDYGQMGLVYGKDDTGTTYNLGLKTTNSERSIILQSARNIALTAEGTGIWINADQFNINVPKERQQGIYARFA